MSLLVARRARGTLAVARTAVLTAALLLAAACRSSAEERPGTKTAAGATPAAGTAAATTSASSGALASAGVATTPPADSTALRAAADSGRIGGAATAKVWLIIASDFQCPYCKMWHDQTYAAIDRDYVQTGKVRVAYLHFPLEQHEQAMATAEASMCASAQGKFWPYQDALFGSQEKWAHPGDQTATYTALAQQVGADVTRFRGCLTSHVMRAVIEADRDRMARVGVQSTPSFFVGNQAIAGAQPPEVFRRALDAALATGAK